MTDDERGHFEQGRWVEPDPTRDPAWMRKDLDFDVSEYLAAGTLLPPKIWPRALSLEAIQILWVRIQMYLRESGYLAD